MRVVWSVECAPEDPVLVVPWHDPDSDAAFVDLRLNPYDFDQLPEAEQYPALMQALRALNAARSPVFTAKCDTFFLEPEQREGLRDDLDLPPADDASPDVAFASYIDLVWRERAIFASFHQQEQQLHRLTRLAAPLNHPHTLLDCVIRSAFVDLNGPQEGFAVSLYLKSLATGPDHAVQTWAEALDSVVALLRSREFAPA